MSFLPVGSPDWVVWLFPWGVFLVIVSLVVRLYEFLRITPWSPRGKTVLIVGGSQGNLWEICLGIGLAIAKELVQRGVSQLILIARNRENLALAQVQCEKLGCPQVQVVVADLTDFKDTQPLLEAWYPIVDCLVLSAGQAKFGYLDDLPLSTYMEQMQLNFLGNVMAIKAFLPIAKASDAPKKIFVVCSTQANYSGIGTSAYAPSKFALRGFCDALRQELVGTKVSIQLSYPPDTDTPGYRQEIQHDVREMDMILPSALFLHEPSQVARVAVNGLVANKAYHVVGCDLLEDMVNAEGALMSPRIWTAPVEILLFPVVRLAMQAFVWRADYIVGREAQKRRLKTA